MNRPVSAAWILALFLAAPAFCPPAGAAYREIHPAQAGDPLAVRIFELDNGLRVYITENHQDPRFYAEIAIRAGGKNDPAATTGLAHYLEHLMFKGNEEFGTLDFPAEKVHLDRIRDLYEEHFKEADPAKRTALYARINTEAQAAARFAVPNEISSLYNTMGQTDLNAHTSPDETVYKVGLPANRLRQWAAIESSRFVRPVFRLFQTELETVYEEKNRSMDNPGNLVFEAVAKKLFPTHPYGQQTVLGAAEHLKKPSLVNIENFYNTYYVPNNMAICISGDIRAAEAMEIIDAAFSSWKRRPLPAPRAWKEAPLQERVEITVPYEGEESVQLAFRTPGKNHPDADALELLALVLSNGEAGLIDLNLNQAQAVRDAGAGAWALNDYGQFILRGSPKAGQSLAEVEKLLLAQLELARQGKFDEGLLKACVNLVKKREKAALERNTSRVSLLRDSFTSLQDWDYSRARISRLEKITAADLVAAARRDLGPGYVAGLRVDRPHQVQALPKPRLDKIQIDANRQSAFAKRILALPAAEIPPYFLTAGTDYQVRRDERGWTCHLAPNPFNDLFTLNLRIDAGTRRNPRLSLAAALLEKSGTARRSAEDLRREWFRLGTQCRITAGEDETVVSLSGLDENLEASLALARELLTQPQADPATLGELVKITLARRADQKKEPAAISAALTEYSRRGGKSSYLQMADSKTLQKATVPQLQGDLADLLRYRRTYSYAGSKTPDQVMQLLEGFLPAEKKLKKPPTWKPLPLESPSRTVICFLDKKTAQSTINITSGDGVFDEALHAPSRLFDSYFGGGMSGIVFQELREARALAYSAGARYQYGRRQGDQNLVTGGIGTQVDKTCDALEAFLDLYDRMPESEMRFEKTRQALLNGFRTNKLTFREIPETVQMWERQGLPGDPRKARFEAIEKAGMPTLLEYYRAHVRNRPRLIAIVGDQARIDLQRLSALGKVRTLEVGDIFAE